MMNLIICLISLIVVANCDNTDWDNRNDAQMLKYINKTNTIEDTFTPVWQRCKCDFSSCDCYVEYLNWNKGSNLARMYFRIDPDVPKKTFTATVYDNNISLRKAFVLQDGLNCHSFKTDIFDKFCLRTYGRAAFSDFNRICIQVGVIVQRNNVISSDIECIKAWPTGSTHMQPSAYENPNLSELNHHLYKLRYSSSTTIGHPGLLALLIFGFMVFKFV